MSNFRDLIARMAIDAEFARHARANPDAVARQYQLSADESEQLRGLADAAASAGPTALGARLSKMGGLTSSLSTHIMLTGTDTDGDGMPDWLDNDDDNDGIPDASDPDPLHKPLPLHTHLDPAHIDPGVVILDQDVLDPNGDPDHDGIPNILDSKNNNPNAAGEPWGDYDHDGKPNVYDPQFPGQYNAYKLMLNLNPDSDGDGIKDVVDSLDHNPDTTHEALGDNDHDGTPNYLDSRFKFPLGDVHIEPGVLDPGGGTTPPPPPPGGDPTPPPGDGGGGGGTDHHDSTPTDTGTPVVADVPQPEAAAAQQPVMLADDALAKPVAPQSDGPSLGQQALIIGGAAIAGGAIVGGVAGVVLNKSKADDES